MGHVSQFAALPPIKCFESNSGSVYGKFIKDFTFVIRVFLHRVHAETASVNMIMKTWWTRVSTQRLKTVLRLKRGILNHSFAKVWAQITWNGALSSSGKHWSLKCHALITNWSYSCLLCWKFSWQNTSVMSEHKRGLRWPLPCERRRRRLYFSWVYLTACTMCSFRKHRHSVSLTQVVTAGTQLS